MVWLVRCRDNERPHRLASSWEADRPFDLILEMQLSGRSRGDLLRLLGAMEFAQSALVAPSIVAMSALPIGGAVLRPACQTRPWSSFAHPSRFRRSWQPADCITPQMLTVSLSVWASGGNRRPSRERVETSGIN